MRCGTTVATEPTRLLWQRPVGGYGYAAPAVSGGLVVTGGYAGRLVAWRAARYLPEDAPS